MDKLLDLYTRHKHEHSYDLTLEIKINDVFATIKITARQGGEERDIIHFSASNIDYMTSKAYAELYRWIYRQMDIQID